MDCQEKKKRREAHGTKEGSHRANLQTRKYAHEEKKKEVTADSGA